MKRYYLLIILPLISIMSAACGEAAIGTAASTPAGTRVTVPGGTYTNLDARTLKQKLDRKDFFLVNVHTPYIGEIANTDAFIPYDQIEGKADLLPKDKNAMIVLYCSSGRMSTIAATKLVKLGYSNVWNLESGMSGWAKAGFSLLKK
jgi:rhodanese-related sulfurtransferase